MKIREFLESMAIDPYTTVMLDVELQCSGFDLRLSSSAQTILGIANGDEHPDDLGMQCALPLALLKQITSAEYTGMRIDMQDGAPRLVLACRYESPLSYALLRAATDSAFEGFVLGALEGWEFDHTLWDELVFAEVDDTSVVQREIAQMFGVSDAERPLLDAEFKNARTLFDVLSSLNVGARQWLMNAV